MISIVVMIAFIRGLVSTLKELIPEDMNIPGRKFLVPLLSVVVGMAVGVVAHFALPIFDYTFADSVKEAVKVGAEAGGITSVVHLIVKRGRS